jgi:Rieske Fe-S protein
VKLSRRRVLESWWVLPVGAAAAFFGWFGLRAFRIEFGKPGAAAEPAFEPGEAHRVAAAAALRREWDAVEFGYPVALGATRAETPAILVRTPTRQPGGLSANGAHYLALSRVCTHLHCTCAYIRDPEVAAVAYNYRPPDANPVLGCACHFSAFDPAQAGKSVSGPAIQPLQRLRLEARGATPAARGARRGPLRHRPRAPRLTCVRPAYP